MLLSRSTVPSLPCCLLLAPTSKHSIVKAKHRCNNRAIQCLLVAAGARGCPLVLNEDELDAARAQIAVAAHELDTERLQQEHYCRTLVVQRALHLCMGLQALELPAAVTLAAVDESLGGLRDDDEEALQVACDH